VKVKFSLLGVVALFFSFGCNEHPVHPLDQVVSASNHQENQLPDQTKIDFLFVMDNSASMCEEQDNLARNFSTFSRFLAVDLGKSVDYRLAVVSTDMYAYSSPSEREMGRFLLKPAPYLSTLNCFDTDEAPYQPNTEDCAALVANGDLEAILSSGPNANVGQDCPDGLDYAQCVQADLERKFRCLATIGTGGDNFEKGLEAMRVGLSCDGPNGERFGICCISDKACSNDLECGGSSACVAGICRGDCADESKCEYDFACQIPEDQAEPEFLRPDALLVVVIISDEDDCSDPITNPSKSSRAICKYGTVDSNGDRIPDGYHDSEICGDRSPEECYRAECNALVTDAQGQLLESAEPCYQQRCKIERELHFCEWNRNDLVPVEEYYRFLSNLKPFPMEQIVVASIVGDRIFTPDGDEITFNPGEVQEGCEGVGKVFSTTLPVNECCPQGYCVGQLQASCSSSNGTAFPGRRYQQLAASFDKHGVAGCDEENGRCVSICSDDFTDNLNVVKGMIKRMLSKYCLDKPPACIVPATGEQPKRSCETTEERQDTQNYHINVRRQCLLDQNSGGFCQEIEIPTLLPKSDWTLELGVDNCAGGALVVLKQTPPAGSEIFLDFWVDLSGYTPQSAAEPDGG